MMNENELSFSNEEIVSNAQSICNSEQPLDKAEKFKDVSVDLVRKAIVAIEKIEKCANKKQFDYTDEQVEKMFAALEEALSDTAMKFKSKKEFSWD